MAIWNRRFERLLDRDWDWLGRNPIRDDFDRARARLSGGRNIEPGRDPRSSGCDRHRAMVMSLAIEHVMSRLVGDTHDRIVSHVRCIVAVVSANSETIELASSDRDRSAASKGGWNSFNHWPPGLDCSA